MSLPIDAPPPGRVPPAASAPWPIQPPPHGATTGSIPVRPVERRRTPVGLVGALVAGAAAAAIGIAIAVPRLLARQAPPAKRSRRRRTKA